MKCGHAGIVRSQEVVHLQHNPNPIDMLILLVNYR